MADIWYDVDTALAAVPINIVALIDDTDFKTREESVTFDQSGLDLLWNFTTTAGAFTQTAVTPTDTAGVYDFINKGNGYYTIEIPASGGGTINNDTEGFGFFSGFATGVLPWRGPVCGFRAAALNNSLVDGATVDVNATAISGDSTAADNLELQFDTTGLAGDTFPATQAQIAGIANVGSATHLTASSYVLTTGTQSSGTISSVAALDGTNHEHTDTAGAMDLYYEFIIGSGTPSSVTVTGYLNGNNDDLEIYGYDWVAAAWVRIGTLAGKNASTNEVDSFDMFVNMVGSGSDEGKVRVRFTDGAFTLTSATLAIDQIFVSFSRGIEGYEMGSIWLDTGHTNTGTVVGIDGVSGNPVSTIGAANTLIASTRLHRLQYAPGSSVTFAADQTDEIHEGRDFTIALGSQNITGSFIFGAIISGTGTATGNYEFEECDIGVVTLDDAGHFETCDLSGTFTVGQAGTFTFHNCFTKSTSAVTMDYAAVGTTHLHMFNFHGELTITNMASGDDLHITGGGSITTSSCTGGTIDHDGFFEYTDAGGNVTEQQSDIKVAVDAVKVQTDKFTFTVANFVDANVQYVNDVLVTGVGTEADPWGQD